MDIDLFKASHAHALNLQPAQAAERQFFTAAHLAKLERLHSFTASVEGKPVMCFGWLELFPHRAVIWALLDKDAGAHMTALTRIGKRLVKTLPHRRIEAEVAAEFDAGRRWMDLIGLTCETPEPLRGYNAHGSDAYIYSKVK